MSGQRLRIALIATGLGRVRRGFESFTESLFRQLRFRVPEVEVTLLQGGGRPLGDGAVVVPNLHRADVPGRWLRGDAPYLLEQRTFAIAAYPRIVAGRYDVVHYNDLVCGSALFHLRRMGGASFKLLFCNGAPSPPAHYAHRCDFVQLLNGPQFSEAVSFGVSQKRIFPVPYGVDDDVFSPRTREERGTIRRELGIPDSAFTVLSVAAIKKEHKRIDYVIREVARVPEAWLVVAGQRTAETQALEAMAESLIPRRWRFVEWPHDRVPALYGAADLFVLASLHEGLGLVTIEAMLSGIPAAIHDSAVSRWIAAGTDVTLADFRDSGALEGVIRKHSKSGAAGTGSLDSLARTRRVASERFGWTQILDRYVRMYRESTRTASDGAR